MREVWKGREFLPAPFTGVLGFFTAFVKHMTMPAAASRVLRAPIIRQVLNRREHLPAILTIKLLCHNNLLMYINFRRHGWRRIFLSCPMLPLVMSAGRTELRLTASARLRSNMAALQ
jgi:hypothetical protein